jgi:hypothetical protein
MMATNRMGAVLSHLQGVVGDMSTLQVQEYSRRLTAGETDSLEVVATQVACQGHSFPYNFSATSQYDSGVLGWGIDKFL